MNKEKSTKENKRPNAGKKDDKETKARSKSKDKADKETKKEKVYVAGVDVSILSERRQFLDANGKLITCSLKEFTKTGILTSYRSLDNFLQAWNDAEKKRAIIEELESQGIIFEELKDEIKNGALRGPHITLQWVRETMHPPLKNWAKCLVLKRLL